MLYFRKELGSREPWEKGGQEGDEQDLEFSVPFGRGFCFSRSVEGSGSCGETVMLVT